MLEELALNISYILLQVKTSSQSEVEQRSDELPDLPSSIWRDTL
jgi:hypothetical protein